MKTIFEQTTRDELIKRINNLSENSAAQWGKMKIYQMIKHCTLWDEWILASQKNKQVFIGRVFGKIALKSILKDAKPLRRNTPTLPEFKIKENNGDIDFEKIKWIRFINDYANFSRQDFVHPFFGKMSKEQIGFLVYKHADHHLRQFNN